jgi:hypothetical protein
MLRDTRIASKPAPLPRATAAVLVGALMLSMALSSCAGSTATGAEITSSEPSALRPPTTETSSAPSSTSGAPSASSASSAPSATGSSPRVASATPPTDGGRARLAAIVAETETALDKQSTQAEIDRTLEAFGERVANDPNITDAAIEEAERDREKINQEAASHGPVPYPSPSTAASIFGVPKQLRQALQKRRLQR